MALLGSISRSSLANWAASVLFGSITSTGRCSRSAIQATDAVFPVPGAASRTVLVYPALTRRSISAIAVGWSPAGTMSVTTWNGATLRCKSVTGRTPPTFLDFPSLSTLGGGSDIPGRPGAAALQVGPDLADPAVEVVEGTRVVDHDVGQRKTLLPAGLGGHPGPGLIRGHAPLADQPLDLHVSGHVHHDNEVEAALAPAFRQQRHVVNQDRSARIRSRVTLGRLDR